MGYPDRIYLRRLDERSLTQAAPDKPAVRLARVRLLAKYSRAMSSVGEASGIHHLSFTPEDVNGKNLICLASTDGVLRTSARLPQ
jgi:hypothetical protein